jgi:hypothetical protein
MWRRRCGLGILVARFVMSRLAWPTLFDYEVVSISCEDWQRIDRLRRLIVHVSAESGLQTIRRAMTVRECTIMLMVILDYMYEEE